MILCGTKNSSSIASLEEPFKHLYFKSEYMYIYSTCKSVRVLCYANGDLL